ncbi:MAG: LamG domain-containing protein [Planctomycetota bacterium]|jgi:hypothetical protein
MDITKVKKIGLVYLILFLLVVGTDVNAETEVVDFESDKWVIEDPAGKVTDYLGRKSLYLKKGRAYLKDVKFENGIVEVDMACEKGLDFPAIDFRVQSKDNYEHFYIRPHKSKKADALQYTPVFNGLSSWQLYSGEGFTAKAELPTKSWIHIKLEISGTQGRVYLNDANKPALMISELKHGKSKGTIALEGFGGKTYFSNFKFRVDNNLKFETVPESEVLPNMITKWQLSNIFGAKRINPNLTPKAQNLSDIKWQKITSGEASGLVNISRYVKKNGQKPEVVFAKAMIQSEKEQVKKLSFGYSDRVNVFLNGESLFRGKRDFRSKGPKFQGIIGLEDSIDLNLKKGNNELILRITEIMGGWGFMCRLENMDGVEIK